MWDGRHQAHGRTPVLHLIEGVHGGGKRRAASDTARAATTDEANDSRHKASALKECAADLTLENRLLKKADCG